MCRDEIMFVYGINVKQGQPKMFYNLKNVYINQRAYENLYRMTKYQVYQVFHSCSHFT